MSTKTVPEKPYRIEERGWPNGVVAVELANRDEALTVFDAIVRTSRRLHAARPELRVVLLGPDRTPRRQLTTEPGGDVHTVTSADGTEWHRMYGGWSPTPLDAPIDFAVLAEFHGPILAGGVR